MSQQAGAVENSTCRAGASKSDGVDVIGSSLLQRSTTLGATRSLSQEVGMEPPVTRAGASGNKVDDPSHMQSQRLEQWGGARDAGEVASRKVVALARRVA